MDHIFCQFCFNDIVKTKWKDHILQKEHVNNLPTIIKVTGAFQRDTVHHIHKYFESFGEIKIKYVSCSEDIVIWYRFKDIKLHSTIIHNTHYVLGKKLQLSSDGTEKNEGELNALRNSLQSKRGLTFDEQFSFILERVRNSSNIQESKAAIYNDLLAVITSAFPKIAIKIDGLAVAGLTIFNDTLNFHIENVDNPSETLEKMSLEISKHSSFTPSIILNDKLFTIQFKYKPKNVTCRLILNNHFAAKRSELIRFFSEVDKKVNELMLVIKCWGKYYNFAEESDILLLLVIFYLQQSPYNLPPVQQLQIGSDFKDGWNCSLVPLNISSGLLKNISRKELLDGFFKYYSTFDMYSNLISLFCGKSMKKVDFMEPYNLPSSFQNYISNKKQIKLDFGLCLQDPFKHSRNLLSRMPSTFGRMFFILCGYSLGVLTQRRFNTLYDLMNIQSERDFIMKKPKGYIKVLWKDHVKQNTLDILKRILFCKVRTENSDEIIHCCCCYDMYTKRLEYMKQISAYCEGYKKESMVSHKLVEDNKSPKNEWNMVLKLKFVSKISVKLEVLIKHEIDFEMREFLLNFFTFKWAIYVEENMRKNRNIQVQITPKKKEKKCLNYDVITFESLVNSFYGGSNLNEQISIIRNKINSNTSRLLSEKVISNLYSLISAKFRKINIHFSELDLVELSFPNRIFTVYLNTDFNLKNLRDIEKLLIKSPDFSGVIFPANGSAVRFTHVETNVLCILTIRNKKMWLYTTSLIKKFLASENLKTVLLIILLWANYHKFSFEFLTSYALHLMLIFYLQQKYELPSVINLQKNTSARNICDWNTSYANFSLNAKLINATIPELLSGFFRFYTKFDYISQVISVYYGSPIDKINFLRPYNLPDDFANYVKKDIDFDFNLGFCVQDIFEHSKNIGSCASVYTSKKFTTLCKDSLCIIGENNSFLSSLLCQNFRNSKEFYKFEIENEKKFDENWKESIRNVTLKIMTEILNYDCSLVSSVENNLFLYNCKGKNDVLTNRLRISKLLSSMREGSIHRNKFDLEVAVTKFLLRDSPKQINLNFEMEIRFKEDLDQMTVAFSPQKSGRRVDYLFIDFLQSKLISFQTESEQKPNEKNVIIVGSDDDDIPSDFFDDFANDDFLKDVVFAEQKAEIISIDSESSGEVIETNKRKRENTESEGLSPDKRAKLQNDEKEQIELHREDAKDKTNGNEIESSAFLTLASNPAISSVTQVLNQNFFIGTNQNSLYSMFQTTSNIPKKDELEKKNAIISLCQKTVEAMTYPRKPSLRLQSSKILKKNSSPLLKSITRFNFTHPFKTNIHEDPFSNILYKIFRKIGLFSEENDMFTIIDSLVQDMSLGTLVSKDIAVKIFQISLLNSMGFVKKKENNTKTIGAQIDGGDY